MLVTEWDDTFFCATSSFNAIPGVPIIATKDLQNFRQIGNVITRESRECYKNGSCRVSSYAMAAEDYVAELPGLATTNGSTGGIWAPTIRYHNNTFFVVTTLVYHNKTLDDPSRWDNVSTKHLICIRSA